MTPTFMTIVQMYQIEGMVAIGKMLNPGTNTITKNIDHARFVIDLLDILSQKTSGNLDADEKRFLENTLSTLRLNFLEEFGNPSAPPPAELA
jgi:hypothetical protein